MTAESLDKIYAEVKKVRLELEVIEKSLDNLAALLLPTGKASLEELKELKALKDEALHGECVSLEEVLKKHREKSSA